MRYTELVTEARTLGGFAVKPLNIQDQGNKLDEEPSPHIKIHRVGLTVTDPNHPMVSKRGETIQKTVRINAPDEKSAIERAVKHYKKQGYKIHDHHYIGRVEEGQVVEPNFGRKSPYYKNPDIEIPAYDPVLKRAWHQAVSGDNPQEPFDSFEAEPAGRTSANIIGIKGNRRVKVSTSTAELANVLVNAYNRGGFTDVPLQKVKLEPTAEPKKSHLSLVKEAINIDAPQRRIDRDELQSYADRIKTGTKTKRDKFSPIIHGSNIKAITKDDGTTEWDLDDLAKQITTRPKKILGTNAKMEKSATEGEIVYDLTLPALSGIVVDESNGDFVEITTCPGAGECQLYCYARKGGYVMFPASSMSAAQSLNFLVNDPSGYMTMVDKEVKSLKTKTDKHGIRLVVRWHDAGDFFSKEYLDLAFKVAEDNPEVKFYAYTKMGDVAVGNKPANFIVNFSTGAKSREVKKVQIHKQAGNIVKDAITVPKDMFRNLFVTDAKGKYVKDEKGRTQVKGEAEWNAFKQELGAKFDIDPGTIITYDQMLQIPEGPKPRWHVVIFPAGHGDRAANRLDVINSFLMFH